MIRILHCADWHLGERKGPVKDGVNLRGKDTIDRIKDIINYARETMPDLVLVSGDVIDKPDVYGKRALSDEIEAERLLTELAQTTKHLVVVRGTPNHDGAEDFIALKEHFRNNPFVDIVTEPAVIHSDGIDIACLPGFDKGVFRAAYPDVPKELEAQVFTRELDNIVKGLKAKCESGCPTVLMAHYYVPGTDTGNGEIFIQKFEPVLSPDALNAANFDLVALGHIHRPQKLENIRNCFYSGAVNRFTFNDEGFPRGFYMHSIDDDGSVHSDFIPLKARDFRTVKLDNDDISAINAGLYDIAAAKWNGNIDQAVIRVRYTCTNDNHKALNHAMLEKRLYEDGAFYVTEILPDDILEEADKKSMGKESDPEANLIEYLQRKEFPKEDIERLSELAKPIISKAMTDVTASAMLGTFVPVSIEVQNYRNYKQESFDFTDITFCTINGENGAGKSSLFMDAIVDCLYEEPREGGNLGDASWVRGTEDAKSGTIIFTFKIGDKTFRVTRKRLKSGSLTLNLSELEDGEWVNRSSEKSPETQKKILQILGMDSLTFKSCALIMQDQYGLFLQASKDDRMTILSNLLGLGLYDSMSQLADTRRKDARSKNDDAKKEIELQEEHIKSYGDPVADLEEQEVYLEAEKENLEKLTKEREQKVVELHTLSDAQERAFKISEGIKSLELKKAGSEAERQRQLNVMTECDTLLNQESAIMEKADTYRTLEEKDKQLIEAKTLYVTKSATLNQSKAEEAKLEKELSDANSDKVVIMAKIDVLSDKSEDDEIRAKAKEYDEKIKAYDVLREKELAYSQKLSELNGTKMNMKGIEKDKEAKLLQIEAERKALEKKTELLASSGCIDVGNANCKFLQDAKSAKQELEKEIPARIEDCEVCFEETIRDYNEAVARLEKELTEIGYNETDIASVKTEIIALKPFKDKEAALQKKEVEIASLKASLDAKDINISELSKRLNTVKSDIVAIGSEVDNYKSAYEESISIQAQMMQLKIWVEKEKDLPVMKERKANAIQRFTELDVQLREIDADIAEKKNDYQIEIQKTVGIEEKRIEVASLEKRIATENELITEIQTEIGALNQRISDISAKEAQIKELRQTVAQFSTEEADYKTLKESFSQDGIPHQIILGILPTLTETANVILGQMTGGKMGVDFQTEKVNTKGKEKVALDVLINEYGKGTLPYLSKSGGEKVKASLAVILALAEIKSSTAGMQLGMLFIDEPPFLDTDGVQAYCDALVTIQRRYPNLKVMAITHDPTMKARFPQNLDVIKTVEGSKVKYI